MRFERGRDVHLMRLVELTCSICDHTETVDGSDLNGATNVDCNGCGRSLPLMFTPEYVDQVKGLLYDGPPADSIVLSTVGFDIKQPVEP